MQKQPSRTPPPPIIRPGNQAFNLGIMEFADSTSMISGLWNAADFSQMMPVQHANWIEVPAERVACYHCGLRYDGPDVPQFCAGCGAGL